MKNYIRLPESGIELKPGMEVMPDPTLYNGPDYDGHKFKVLEVDKEREEALIQWSHRPAQWFYFGHLFVQDPIAPKRKRIFNQTINSNNEKNTLLSWVPPIRNQPIC